jgi:hypothetical protein
MELPEGRPAPKPPDIDIGLVSDTTLLSDEVVGFFPAFSDGNTLTVRDIYPGSYRVQFLTDPPVPYFLDSIRLGEQVAVGSFPVASAALPLTISFKLGGGAVRGPSKHAVPTTSSSCHRSPLLRKVSYA